jgi:hypothetical protein
MKITSSTALKLELTSRWWIHTAIPVSWIEPFCIASNLIGDPPAMETILTDNNELQYDIAWYEYQTRHQVEETMGSQFNKGWKRVLYLVKCTGYTEETDWIEEPYENCDDK